MDRNRRSILFSLLAVVLLAVLALLAALIVPFPVELSATVQRFSGSVELLAAGSPPATLDPAQDRSPITLRVGQTLRVAPDGTAIVALLERGRVTLDGPAMLTLVESSRRATVLGHLFSSGRFQRETVITLEQTQGRARYDFAHASPPFAVLDITLELPGRTYRPESPCWTVTISAQEEVRAAPWDCVSAAE